MTDPLQDNIHLHISSFPNEVLQRVFQIGVEEAWVSSMDKIEQHEHNVDEEEDQEDDDNESGNTHENNSGCFQRFTKGYNPFATLPELVTLLNCAEVCKTWADAIINKDFWHSVLSRGSFNDALAEPWKLGKRWNRLLKDVPVPILCMEEDLLSNIGKIHTSLRRGRDAFEVYILSNSEEKKQIFDAWSNLQPILQTNVPRLTITNQRIESGRDVIESTPVGFETIALKKWPLLQSLDIDFAQNGIVCREVMRDWGEFIRKTAEMLSADPPFPSLKNLVLSTHVDTAAARNVTLVAPHVDHFHLRISGYQDDSLLNNWDRLRNCGVLWQFLEQNKRYRTYITPYCIHAFKWPGPKTMSEFEKGWRFMSFMATNSPDSGVLISERRNGKRCEIILTLDQFFQAEDLRAICVPLK